MTTDGWSLRLGSMGWTPRAALTTCVLALLFVAGLCREAGADASGTRCDKKSAEPVFVSGIGHYARKQWEAAIPDLGKAAKLCPMPNGPWVIPVFDFAEVDYVPFYYLGRCHYSANSTEGSFKALQHFYLSSCLAEPKRHSGTTKDLNDFTEQCRRRIASQRQPQQHPAEFSEGLKAFDHDWDKAAENMWDALQIEPDDGQMKLSSRWPDPYLPGLRLAKALVELGCIREACSEYDRFQFKDLVVKTGPKDKYKDERQFIQMLSTECAGKNRERTANNETCQRWRCWVGEGRP